MAAAGSLRRLYKIRETEEHMSASALQSANHELHQYENALRHARERAAVARRSLPSMLASGGPEDRIAGFEEISAADRVASALSARISVVQQRVNELRRQFFLARIQRKQAQTLLDQFLADAKVEADRRAQMALDEWHRSQLQRIRRNHEQRVPASKLSL